MNIKYSFKEHLINKFLLYIFSVAAVTVGVSYGIVLKTNPHPEETISIFIAAKKRNDLNFDKHLETILSNDILEINVHSYDFEMPEFNITYLTQGQDSDLLILPKELLDEQGVGNYFVR